MRALIQAIQEGVAETILDQMGGKRKLVTMVGASAFVSGHKDGGARDGVSFRFKGSSKVNYVKILLTGADDYTVEFGKISGFNYKVVKTFTGVYADRLKPVFEQVTGLYLTL